VSPTSDQDDEHRRKIPSASLRGRFPAEINEQIFSYIEEITYDRAATESRKEEYRANRKTLCSATRVCGMFERIVTPLLYSLIAKASVSNKCREGYPRFHLLVRTLLARPERANLLQTIVTAPIDSHFGLASLARSRRSEVDLTTYQPLLTSMQEYLEAD
jgi:hypothetical protein